MQDSELELSSRPRRPSGVASVAARALIPIAVLVVGALGFVLLSRVPESTPRAKEKPRVIKTRAIELRAQEFQTEFPTRGVVRPHNEVTLTPEVSGRIVRVAAEFEDGAFFSAGDVLIELDKRDYEAAVVVAQAQLARAQSAHAQEKTRAEQARLNWDDLGYDEEPNELVLRKPQLREAKANVDSAQAQLDQANRNLDRTKVRASFDGRVRHRNVGVGQSVGTGTPLGSVFSIDYAEIRLPIDSRDMRYLSLPEDPDDPPLAVELRDALDPSSTTVWTGKIVRTEGALDENSLELFGVARVFDPFGRDSGLPPLRIGQPVIGTIRGTVLEDVLVVPRAAVHKLDRIYLIDPDKMTLRSHTIVPIWSNKERVVVRDPNVLDGTLLATTHLSYAPEDSAVEVLPDVGAEAADIADADAAKSDD